MRQKAFKGKLKIQDKWKEDIYVIIAQSIEDFPILMVQNERSKKSKALHRNMPFPMSQELKCEDISQKVKISDSMSKHEGKGKNLEEVESDSEEKQDYEGPVTRARTKVFRTSEYFDGSVL